MKERKLEVYLGERFVGTMAQTADRRVAFAYSEEWLDNGFAISPFSLPVEQKVFVPTSQTFSGLWGVFADSLPDAWGAAAGRSDVKGAGNSFCGYDAVGAFGDRRRFGNGRVVVPPGVEYSAGYGD